MPDAVEDARAATMRARNERGAANTPKVKAAQTAYDKAKKALDAFTTAMRAIDSATAPVLANSLDASMGHAKTVLDLEASNAAADVAAR